MIRTVATLSPGSRITSYISPGVIAQVFPSTVNRAALAEAHMAGVRPCAGIDLEDGLRQSSHAACAWTQT
jgi:hypothetical protein